MTESNGNDVASQRNSGPSSPPKRRRIAPGVEGLERLESSVRTSENANAQPLSVAAPRGPFFPGGPRAGAVDLDWLFSRQRALNPTRDGPSMGNVPSSSAISNTTTLSDSSIWSDQEPQSSASTIGAQAFDGSSEGRTQIESAQSTRSSQQSFRMDNGYRRTRAGGRPRSSCPRGAGRGSRTVVGDGEGSIVSRGRGRGSSRAGRIPRGRAAFQGAASAVDDLESNNEEEPGLVENGSRSVDEQESDVSSVCQALEDEFANGERLSIGSGWCASIPRARMVSTVRSFYQAFHDANTMPLYTCRICYVKVSKKDLQSMPWDLWEAIRCEWSRSDVVPCSSCFPPRHDVDCCVDCLRMGRKGFLSQAAQLHEGLGCEHRYPEELRHLSPVEEKLIALNSCYGFITKYTAVPGARQTATYPRHVRGHITVFPSNVQELAANVLPHPLVSVMEDIHVAWQGKEKPLPRDLSKLLSVRPRVVKRALAWLKRHNPLYESIQIDETELSRWEETEHGVPGVIYERLEHSEPSAREKARTAHIVPAVDRGLEPEAVVEIPELLASLRATPRGDEDSSGETEPVVNSDVDVDADDVQELSASGMFGLDSGAGTADSERLRFFCSAMGGAVGDADGSGPSLGAAAVQNRALEPFVVISRGDEFAESFDPAFLPKTFPTLFPFRRGGPARAVESVDGTARDDSIGLASTRNMTLATWAKILLQRHGGRFPHHYAFSFLVFNLEVRARNRRVSMASVKRRDFGRLAGAVRSLSPEKLERARQELEALGKTTDEDAKLVLRHLTSFGYRQPMSRESRMILRKKIKSLIIRYGLPALWFTINPNDITNPVKLRLAAYRFHEPAEAERFLNELDRGLKRTRLAVSDPLGSALFFHRELTTFFEHYVKTGEESVFGRVSQYFGAVETNERGALHIHGLMWLAGSEALESLIGGEDVSDEEKAAIIRYVDSIICQVSCFCVRRQMAMTVTDQDRIWMRRPVLRSRRRVQSPRTFHIWFKWKTVSPPLSLTRPIFVLGLHRCIHTARPVLSML